MQQKKKMKEVFAEIESMFHAIPKLEQAFKNYERDIRYYNCNKWDTSTTKERLIKKRNDLLEVATTMNHCDLLVLYYIKNIESLGVYKMLGILRELYRSQCEAKNKLYNTDEYVDIIEIGARSYGEPSENGEKTAGTDADAPTE